MSIERTPIQKIPIQTIRQQTWADTDESDAQVNGVCILGQGLSFTVNLDVPHPDTDRDESTHAGPLLDEAIVAIAGLTEFIEEAELPRADKTSVCDSIQAIRETLDAIEQTL